MKKSLKELKLNKKTISKLNFRTIKGGLDPTQFACHGVSIDMCGNSVPIAQGGIGCHLQ
jgi:hypothetical protein